MRKIEVIGLMAIMIWVAALQARAQNWEIVPGRSVGPITRDTSEKDLIRIYGASFVKRVNVDVGEGETQPGTVVFPANPAKKIFILWRDPATRLHPESVSIRGKNSLWKTDRGITIGTPLKTIEELNGGAFALTGFAWDYSGTVLHSNGGRLSELGNEKGEDIEGRTLILRLEPTSAQQSTAAYNSVMGDGKFLSNHAAMQKLNPRVYEMIVEFPEAAVSEKSEAVLEKDLVDAIKDVQKYTVYGGDYDEDKLATAQKNFENKLVKYTKTPSTLNYRFSELDEHVSIATSADGKFRIYSWDLQNGGTMHNFARLYQYLSSEGKVYSKTEELPEEGMGPGFVTDIFTLETSSGPVYIVCSTFIGSTKDYSQSATLYRIEGSTLNDNVKLIKTRSGLTNSLRFEYDNFSVIDREDRPEKLIYFDEKTKVLKIPVVVNDEKYPEGRVTDKFISYRFDGKYFVKTS
jgi:hypothetical protein